MRRFRGLLVTLCRGVDVFRWVALPMHRGWGFLLFRFIASFLPWWVLVSWFFEFNLSGNMDILRNQTCFEEF